MAVLCDTVLCDGAIEFISEEGRVDVEGGVAGADEVGRIGETGIGVDTDSDSADTFLSDDR